VEVYGMIARERREGDNARPLTPTKNLNVKVREQTR